MASGVAPCNGTSGAVRHLHYSLADTRSTRFAVIRTSGDGAGVVAESGLLRRGPRTKGWILLTARLATIGQGSTRRVLCRSHVCVLGKRWCNRSERTC